MNALVSYASDSDSDSGSDSRDVHPTITAAVVQKSVPSTPAVSTTTKTATTSSAAPSKHHTPEGTPGGTQTAPNQDGTNPQQDNKDEQSQQQQQDENAEEDDDDFVSAALKDLQSFAATIDDSTTTTSGQGDDTSTTPITTPVEASPSTTAIPAVLDAQPPQDSDQLDSIDMEVDQPDTATAAASATTVPQPETPIELTTEQQIVFDTFLQEINAIPLLPSPSSINQQPPRPPRTSSQSLHDSTSTFASTSKSPAGATITDDDEEWIQQQTPQTIYSRIHQLSTLPATERFSPKEVEDRLIEFAIRLLDWEQGGLKPVYFLGQERANKEQRLKGDKKMTTKEEEEEGSGESGSDDDDEDEETMLPGYGGIVGEMIEYMHAVEKIAAPDDHWSIVWSLKELSYSFLHPAAGAKSTEFPSTELRNRLNSPSSSSSTTILTASS